MKKVIKYKMKSKTNWKIKYLKLCKTICKYCQDMKYNVQL